MRHEKCTKWLFVLWMTVALLTACGTTVTTPAPQNQPPVASWSDLEVQRVNIVRVSATSVRVDITYLIKLLKPNDYSFFFHFTDQAGNMVAQLDEPINLFSTGEVSWSRTLTIPPSASGKLRVVMGRYGPVNGARIATINGLEQIEIRILD